MTRSGVRRLQVIHGGPASRIPRDIARQKAVEAGRESLLFRLRRWLAPLFLSITILLGVLYYLGPFFFYLISGYCLLSWLIDPDLSSAIPLEHKPSARSPQPALAEWQQEAVESNLPTPAHSAGAFGKRQFDRAALAPRWYAREIAVSGLVRQALRVSLGPGRYCTMLVVAFLCIVGATYAFYKSDLRYEINACPVARGAVQAHMRHPYWIDSDSSFCHVIWTAKNRLEVSGQFRGPNERQYIVNNDYDVVMLRKDDKLKVIRVDYDDGKQDRWGR